MQGLRVCFGTWLSSYGEELLETGPNPKLEDHPLSALNDCLFNIFAAVFHIGGRSSLRNLRMRHAMSGTHLSQFRMSYSLYFTVKQFGDEATKIWRKVGTSLSKTRRNIPEDLILIRHSVRISFH